MNTDTGLALQRAAAIARGQAALARLVGVRPQTYQQWANGQRPIPPKRAYRIEAATGIDRRWFRLDDWREHWPELVNEPIRMLPAAPDADEDSNSALAARAA
ncbi:helix-turn-helix domain-containing protein [Burkholderia multivorans]|uniref:helix-turn-helix domain-containing protein n=1 Tax=Burkholderia multivorans TaxID=87883 RepID=UPI001C21B878|nr:helix-turn-helix transcriptional regulator [Burkholderia multivorans]MBU9468326.1 helix-turn-helix domain-containing protein [Burkholderia multivorans]MCA8129405.1 helix-turn-helix domain-containing protein [Burkholderia multivorans]